MLHKRPKSFTNWYRDLFLPRASASPPFDHVVQLGDPVLRLQCEPVAPDRVDSAEVRRVVDALKRAMSRYDALGMSAPQVGSPLRIMCVQMTRRQVDMLPQAQVEAQHVEEIPMRVVINPVLSVTNNEQVIFRESCCSMNGFSAIVPRAKEVTIEGIDERGEKVIWKAKNFTARVFQHEMDHLVGKLYIDRMATDSLVFAYWNTVNKRGGDFRLGYDGIGVKHRMFPFNFYRSKNTVEA
jgi:peptide deformylase